MQPSKQTVHQVFDISRRLVVPLYQRAYVWSRDDQWVPFFEDIQLEAIEYFRDGGQSTSEYTGHFMGAIVTQAQMVAGGGHPSYYVIDGQQRLTTFQLLLKAFHDLAARHGHWSVDELKRLIRNPPRPHIGPEEVYKVWPSNADRSAFEQVMKASGPTELQQRDANGRPVRPPRLVEAYLHFYAAIEDFIEGHESEEGVSLPEATPGQRIDVLYQALAHRLFFVVIELEGGDDPQVIFETLNARGVPLLPSDLIRNDLFFRAAREKQKPDALYESYWQPFEETRLLEPINGESRFWHVLDRQGRLERPRIDLFVFHWLTVKEPKDLIIGKLYQTFRDWAKAGKLPVEQILRDLAENRERYARLISPVNADVVATTAQRLKAIDTSTVYPLLLFLLSLPPERLPPPDLRRILLSVESYLVRRLITAQPTNRYNKTFMELLISVKTAAAASDSLAELIDQKLKSLSGPSVDWPDDDKLRLAVLDTPLYVKSRQERTRMVLKAIEDRLRGQSGNKVEEPLGNEHLSIEHLLPQGARVEDYPIRANGRRGEGETPEEARERLIHTLGNLTLLTQPLNSSVSNGPFAAKKAGITRHTVLRLNSFLFGENAPSIWDELAITARGKSLYEDIKSIWPRPP
jgi:uncharacterized protein with ParB-like and HNH nuclease domain